MLLGTGTHYRSWDDGQLQDLWAEARQQQSGFEPHFSIGLEAMRLGIFVSVAWGDMPGLYQDLWVGGLRNLSEKLSAIELGEMIWWTCSSIEERGKTTRCHIRREMSRH